MSVTAPVLELGKTNANLPFEIHSMDWIDKNRWHQNSVPHRHNYFVIIWVKTARGVHVIDMDKFKLENDTVYCITPGQIHQLNIEGLADGYVISFTADFMGIASENFDLLFDTGLFFTFSHSPVIKVKEDEKEEMEEIAAKMTKEFGNYFLLRAEILREFLKIFLIYLTRQYRINNTTEPQRKTVELVKNFFVLIDRNYLSMKMVTDYAATLVVTPSYLNEVVKKVTGFPASHHIQQRIILEAKRKAGFTTQTMKEIAYDLGFDDVAHFSKFFKNGAGQSFSEFRKGYSKKMEEVPEP